jgi:hypothetical protein
MKLERLKVNPPGTDYVNGILSYPDGRLVPEEDLGESFWFWCPGCDSHHRFSTKLASGEQLQENLKPKPRVLPVWTFNGKMHDPSFSPSLLYPDMGRGKRCHLHLKNGHIEYCSDSSHGLAGKRIKLGEMP